jgi:hypothetical protein
MFACLSVLLIGLPGMATNDTRDVEGKAAASFKGICSRMKRLMERAEWPPLISLPNEQTKALHLFTRLRVARMTSTSTAKVILSVHFREEPDENREVVVLNLSYYDGKWSVSSKEATRGYSSGSGKDELIKLIMLLEESQ